MSNADFLLTRKKTAASSCRFFVYSLCGFDDAQADNVLRACEARVCASVGKKQVSGRILGDPGLIDEPSNTHVPDFNTQIF